MKGRANKIWTRTKLAIAQNRAAIGFVVGWVGVNAALFVQMYGMTRTSAVLLAACVDKAQGGWPGVYQSFTEVVVFGVVASLVLTNVTRRYRPEETCRALARQARDHVLVVGLTNLGRRVYDLARDAGVPVVVVDEDPSELRTLVHDEEPAIVGSPRDRTVLEAAGAARAKVVVIATDDLEAAAVAARVVRELNATCELVVRCPDDDVGSVIARTYRARAVSTSRVAAHFVLGFATKARARAVLVLGGNSVGARVAEALEHKRIPHVHVPVTEDPAALAQAGAAEADLVVVCDDDLGKNLIRVDRIRDLNPRAKIVCRAFHDDAAEMLRRPPFDCTVLSSSRHAAAALAKAGAFRAVGIDDAPLTATPAALAEA
jgi:Trk K+ transport system NAD-binding subunit